MTRIIGRSSSLLLFVYLCKFLLSFYILIRLCNSFTPSTGTVFVSNISNNNNYNRSSLVFHRNQLQAAVTSKQQSSIVDTTKRNTNSMKQIRRRMNEVVRQMKTTSNDDNYYGDTVNMNDDDDDNLRNNGNDSKTDIGKLEELKQREAELSALLAEVRREKLSVIRSRPLTIGIIGYGRFGQFIAKTFTKYGNVIVTSRSDYTDIATDMGCTYVPMDQLDQFVQHDLDVIVVATSIVSFESTIQMLAPFLQDYIQNKSAITRGGNEQSTPTTPAPARGPLIVDVLSVKEHARQIMIQHLPLECDLLCTHPMFGPDSGKNGWYNLNFVYEKTRINTVLLQQQSATTTSTTTTTDNDTNDISSSPSKRARTSVGVSSAVPVPAFISKDGTQESLQKQKHQQLVTNDTFIDDTGTYHSVYEQSDAHVEGMDRMERFLSIWEEEGCKMVPMSCVDHDMYAANSQFITHLIGRVLANQGLESTPIDTSGFQSVLKLIQNTVSDSFDLFYGLYKYNRKNSYETIQQLQAAMNDVVTNLQQQEAIQTKINTNHQQDSNTSTSTSSNHQ